MTDTQPRTPAGSPAGGQFGTKPGGAESNTGLATASDRSVGAALIDQLPEHEKVRLSRVGGYDGDQPFGDELHVCYSLVRFGLLPDNFRVAWDDNDEGSTAYQLSVEHEALPNGRTWLSTYEQPNLTADDRAATGLAAAAIMADILASRAAALTEVSARLTSTLG